MNRKKTFSLLAFALLLLLGILASTQIRSISDARKRLEATAKDNAYYSGLIATESARMTELRQNIDDLTVQKESLLESVLENTGDQAILDQLKKVRSVAGFTPVSGSGILVTLDDSALRTPDTDPASSIIHDGDVRQVVDLLRAAGAIAISVNDQRIVPTSELICNGPTIEINGLKYPVPYRIAAVGDITRLTNVIEADELLGYRKAEGISIRVEPQESLTIPGFDGADRVVSLIDALEVTQP